MHNYNDLLIDYPGSMKEVLSSQHFQKTIHVSHWLKRKMHERYQEKSIVNYKKMPSHAQFNLLQFSIATYSLGIGMTWSR